MMKKNFNLENAFKEIIDKLISSYQVIILLLGCMCFFIPTYFRTNSWSEFFTTFLEQVGGCLITIAVVTIAYERLKEKKKEELDQNTKKEKYFILDPSDSGSGYELKKYVNLDTDNGKIILTGAISDKEMNKKYGFPYLLRKDFLRLINKNVPLFSYGTLFPFLNKEKRPDYYHSISNAIKNGLGLRVSIINPLSKTFVQVGESDITSDAAITIQNFIDIIETSIAEKWDNKPVIELRLSLYYSPCSFSSLLYNSGRVIRSLEYNFRHENNQKLTQIYDIIKDYTEDNDHIEQNINDSLAYRKFSRYLFKRYNRLYKESILALRYPMRNDVTFYVLGVLTDVNDKFKTKELDQNRLRRYLITTKKKLIQIIIHQSIENNRIEWQVNRGNRYITHNPIEIADTLSINFEIAKTILGNVLYEYYQCTGTNVDVPNNSGLKIDIKSAYSINELDTDSGSSKMCNEFVLVGTITETRKNVDSINKIEIESNKNILINMLQSINCDPETQEKILASINIS